LELFPFPHNIKGRPYTGLLAPTQKDEHCMVRLSLALQPMDNHSNGLVAHMMFGPKLVHSKQFTGMSIKLFCSKHNMESQTEFSILFDFETPCHTQQLQEPLQFPQGGGGRAAIHYYDYNTIQAAFVVYKSNRKSKQFVFG
jgi:hypothetical protein